MVFIYSSYQKYCANLQKEVQENIPIPLPPGALEGLLNTAGLSLAGNLILSKGQLQPAVNGTLCGLSIKILELMTWIFYKSLQDYIEIARRKAASGTTPSLEETQQTLSDPINTPGKIITMVISGIEFLGLAYYLKISKINMIAALALVLLRKIVKSETTEILFLMDPKLDQTLGEYLSSLRTYRSIL